MDLNLLFFLTLLLVKEPDMISSQAVAMASSRAVAMASSQAVAMSSSQTGACRDTYPRFSQQHSFCQAPSETCIIKQATVTPYEKDSIVDFHNSFRSIIASGQKSGNGMPYASDMIEMEWDEELAAVAQNYAKQCVFAHDCPNCRRVLNFGVGQNIAMQSLTGNNLPPPKPDWSFAVREWFEEIVYFNKDKICPFEAPTGGEYRHFTQLIWANTFRVGCGYVLYQEGITWTSLYICNYGPAGNVYNTCVYKEGPTCSQCPINTCCGASCKNGQTKFPGLCKRINDKPPRPALSTQQTILFDCDFEDPNKKDCFSNQDGDGSYKVISALGGYYLETILYPGQKSSLNFTKPIKPINEKFCVIIYYRKGPIRAGNPETNDATEIFIIPEMNSYTYSQKLPSYPEPSNQQFSSFKLSLQWKAATYMKINFSVPPNGNAQFLNIKSITAVDGTCQ